MSKQNPLVAEIEEMKRRANVYPQLVDALHEARTALWHLSTEDRKDPYGAHVDRIDALLRELGEL